MAGDNMNDLSEKISAVLNDPESMKLITEIAGNLAGNSSAVSDDAKTEVDAEPVESTQNNIDAQQVGTFSVIGSTVEKLLGNGDIDNTVRLVTALKPYMSTHRRESAESVLRILGLMKLMGNGNLSEMMKLFGKNSL